MGFALKKTSPKTLLHGCIPEVGNEKGLSAGGSVIQRVYAKRERPSVMLSKVKKGSLQSLNICSLG